MPIPVHMQGSWTVSLKTKSAAWPQRVVVQGATGGDYAQVLTGAPWSHTFTGASWSVHIEHDPGTGWQASHQRLKFPTAAGGQISFDIETDDMAGDGDFNDAVLSCATMQAAGEHVVYGSVSAYRGNCWYNPCSRRPYLVIDTLEGLERAWKIPAVAKALAKLRAPKPEPPDPNGLRKDRFVPVAIPMADDRLIPPRRVLSTRTTTLANGARAVVERSTTTASALASPALEFDRVAIARAADAVLRGCVTEKLAGYALRFQEYDRTHAEAAGGAYTGLGDRSLLGAAVTDAAGNYIFRFSRSAQEIGEEYGIDVTEGEDVSVAGLPDVIAQVLAGGPSSASFHESYPRWNVGPLTRIDLCFPASKIPSPATCEGVRNLQRLGDVSTLEPSFNHWSAEGRITAHSANIPGGWQADCAAWAGYVEFIGCFSTEVERWAVRWRKTTDPAGEWRFWNSPERRLLIANLFNYGYTGDPIGPLNDQAVSYATDPPTNGTNWNTYSNIAYDNAWVASEWFRLFTLNTAALQAEGGPGSYVVRVDGLDAAGNEIGGDQIELYIDNDIVDVAIEQMDFSGLVAGTPGVCNLITLPSPDAPLTITFRAHEALGFMHSYAVSASCCTPLGSRTIPVTLDASLPPTAFGSIAPGTDCDPLANEGASTGSLATAAPAAGDSWLGGADFGVVTVSVSGNRRATNGKNTGVQGTWTASASFGIKPS